MNKSLILSRFYTLLFITLLTTKAIYAGWTDSMPISLRQPDGTTIEAYLTGDEFYTWTHDVNHYNMIRDFQTGFYCWAILDNDALISTGIPVHLQSPNSLGLSPGENISAGKYLEIRGLNEDAFYQSNPYTPILGDLYSITIFIRFAPNINCDTPGHVECIECIGATEFPYTYDEVDELFNGFTFDNPCENTPSLYRYFWEISYENLKVKSPIIPINRGGNIISYQAPEPKSYYLPHDHGFPNGTHNATEASIRRQQLFRDAVLYFYYQNLIPSSFFINSLNSSVDNINFIIRGAPRYPHTPGNIYFPIIAAYKTTFSPSFPIHGKQARNYNVHPETSVFRPFLSREVGLLAHELSHSLGFPDMYHRQFGSLGLDCPVGIWDLMTGGKNPPQAISSYTKWQYARDWVHDSWQNSIPTISQSGRYILYPITDIESHKAGLPTAYRINSPHTNNEYFVVEYRVNTGDFIDNGNTVPASDNYSIPGSGLVVYRVNTLKSGSGNYYIADGSTDYELYVYRPNKTEENKNDRLTNYSYYSTNADYHLDFPDYSHMSINSTTNPSPLLIDGTNSGLHITNIGNAGETISFYFSTTEHEHDIVAHKLTGPLQVTVDTTANFQLEVINIGTTQANGYTVQLRNGKQVLASIPGIALPTAQSHIYTFSWAPTVESQFLLSGFVEYTPDQKTSNNQSPSITVSTQTDPTMLWVEPEHCIQAAINMLMPNGTLTLKNGIHEAPCSVCNQSTVYLNEKNIKIQGSTNQVAETIVKQRFEISNVTNATTIEKITFEPIASDNYATAIKLINSTPKIDNLKFNMNSNFDIVGIHVDLSALTSDAVMEISNTVFNGNQGIYLNGHDNFLSKLFVSYSEFYENSSIFGHYGEGSAITFKGTHFDVRYSKFNMQEIDTKYTNPIQIVLKNNDLDKIINIIGNEFTTHRNIQPTTQNQILFTPTTQQTILVGGNGRYNFLAEKNIFKRINHVTGDTTTNNIIVLGVSPISPNFETRLFNNSDVSLVSSSNNTLTYLDNPNIYSFVSHGGKLTAKNNLLTGIITTTSGSAVNDVQATWNIGIQGNPNIDLLSIQPIWNQTIKSGLINAGHPDTNGNDILWWDDIDDQDADGTRLDIGAIPAITHGRFTYRLKPQIGKGESVISGNYHWISFPYLDKLYQGLIGTRPADHIYHNLHLDNENGMYDSDILDHITWNYNDNQGTHYGGSSVIILPSEPTLDSRMGYKIRLQPDVSKDFTVSGFLAGLSGNDDIFMRIEPESPHREIWVGYFLQDSVDPLIALQQIERYLIEIKTQKWSMNRSPITGEWIVSVSYSPRFNFGEAVSLKYVGDDTIIFKWKHDDDIRDYYIHPEIKHFTFDEQIDYLPIYVYLPDDYAYEEFGEIGMFINDICYGAEVIMSEMVQINAYVLDIDYDDIDIEFRIYQYGVRSGEKRISNYAVLHNESKKFQQQKLDLSTNELFYVVSFKEEEVGDIGLPTQTIVYTNYPNPFNPTTTISYDIASESNVRIDIYNIRGQKVKTLVDEHHIAGRYKADWHGNDDNNRNVASGVYFYRMSTSDYSSTKRMLLLK